MNVFMYWPGGNARPSMRRWIVILVCAICWICLSRTSDAYSVGMTLYTGHDLQGADGNSLPVGSTIIVVGSGDDVIDDMLTYGTEPDSPYIAATTTGDDIILAHFTIDSNGGPGGPGGFAKIFDNVFDSDVVNYVYIRFFDYQGLWVEGSNIVWGLSYMSNVTDHTLYDPWVTVDIAAYNDLQVDKTNDFVVIPEPSTFRFLLFTGFGLLCMFFYIRVPVYMRERCAKKKALGGKVGEV